MLEAVELNAVVAGALVAVAAVAGLLRKRWYVGVAVALIGLGTLLVRDLLPGSDAGLPWEQAGALLAWLMLGHVARAAGGPILSSSWGFSAVMAGWLLGDIGAAALFAGLCADKKLAARCALVASGAALMSPIGTPTSLVLVDPAALGPLPVALALVAWPRGSMDDGKTPKGKLWVTAVLAMVAGAVNWMPEWRLLFLLLGIGALAAGNKGQVDADNFPSAQAAWVVAAMVVAWVVRTSGLGRFALDGAHEWLNLSPSMGPITFAGGGVISAAMLGEAGAVPIALSVVDSTAGVSDPSVRLALAGGIGVGGLGPLIASGGFKHGWKPWLMQVGLVLAWAGLLLGAGR